MNTRGVNHGQNLDNARPCHRKSIALAQRLAHQLGPALTPASAASLRLPYPLSPSRSPRLRPPPAAQRNARVCAGGHGRRLGEVSREDADLLLRGVGEDVADGALHPHHQPRGTRVRAMHHLDVVAALGARKGTGGRRGDEVGRGQA